MSNLNFGFSNSLTFPAGMCWLKDNCPLIPDMQSLSSHSFFDPLPILEYILCFAVG
jgi:hypothetical protein